LAGRKFSTATSQPVALRQGLEPRTVVYWGLGDTTQAFTPGFRQVGARSASLPTPRPRWPPRLRARVVVETGVASPPVLAQFYSADMVLATKAATREHVNHTDILHVWVLSAQGWQ